MSTKQPTCGVKHEVSGGACTGAPTEDDGEGKKRCLPHAAANLRRLLAAARADLPPEKYPRLEELLTGLHDRRANLAAHLCAGFDCVTCEPSRDVEELDEVIDMVTGRNVE